MKHRSIFLLALFTICSLYLIGCDRDTDPPITLSGEPAKIMFGDEDFDAVHQKSLLTNEVLPTGQLFPRSIEDDGSWYFRRGNDWTSGFYPGVLWLLAKRSHDPELINIAYHWTKGLEEQKNNRKTHDTGFIMHSSYGQAHKLTGDSSFLDVLITTSESLISRFDPNVGLIRSWDFPAFRYPVIIDNMMNLEMLFYVSEQTGNSKYAEIAELHAKKSGEYHIREDGSSIQLIDFDPATGDSIKTVVNQGYKKNSAWSRGQAWAIYGFVIAYRETGNSIFLETALASIDYYLKNIPEDGVPYWDFDIATGNIEDKDVSASVIAAAGIAELLLITEVSEKQEMLQYLNLLYKTLSTDKYRSTNNYTLFSYSMGSKPHNSEVARGIIYAEYYYLDFLHKYNLLSSL